MDGEVDDVVAWMNAYNNNNGFDDVVTARSSNNDLFGAKKIGRISIFSERNTKETDQIVNLMNYFPELEVRDNAKICMH